MTFGKEIRWRRLFHRASGRMVTLAIDHGTAYKFELPPALASIAETVRMFLQDPPDAIVAQEGLFGEVLKPFAGKVPLILQTISITPSAPDDSYVVSTVEDAVALGADAVAMAVSVGGAAQRSALSMLGELVRRARPLGLPVIAHVYPLGEAFRGAEYSPSAVAYSARAGAEVGADVVKVHYTGDRESFAKIVRDTPIGVVAAGGPRLESAGAVLAMARDVAWSGALGLTIGRNLWEDPRPAALLKAIHSVVHENVSPEDAERTYGGSLDTIRPS